MANTNELERLLTEGLISGYAGGSTIFQVIRGELFKGKSSHIEFPDGNIYHDEWFGNYQGGGQELIIVGDTIYTRLYAGGTPEDEVLSKLGISRQDINNYLKQKIKHLGDRTRLFDDCLPEAEPPWQYSYIIMQKFAYAALTLGCETIKYKSTPVHVHPILISPVK